MDKVERVSLDICKAFAFTWLTLVDTQSLGK
jgi:hypothetical protein